MQLLYFADPMCSWCYGFGPELSRLLERHGDARLDLVMGGLRPYHREPMSEPFRAMLREHWDHVAAASALPFNVAAVDAEGFTYDTEPACRAVVTARHLDASRAFAFFKAVQAAFYGEGRDTTRAQVLADVAAESGYERDAFLRELESEERRQETRADFASTQATGVSGFPTLGVARDGQLYLVTAGYVTDDVLEHRLVEIERRLAAPGTA